MYRRSIVFLCAAVAAAAMVAVAPEEFRHIAWIVAGVYVFFALLSALDSWSAGREP